MGRIHYQSELRHPERGSAQMHLNTFPVLMGGNLLSQDFFRALIDKSTGKAPEAIHKGSDYKKP